MSVFNCTLYLKTDSFVSIRHSRHIRTHLGMGSQPVRGKSEDRYMTVSRQAHLRLIRDLIRIRTGQCDSNPQDRAGT